MSLESSGSWFKQFILLLLAAAISLFIGWSRGAKSAALPALALEVDAVMRAPKNHSFQSPESVDQRGVSNNVKALLEKLSSGVKDVSSINAISSLAFSLDCAAPLAPENPQLLDLNKSESHMSVSNEDSERKLRELCLSHAKSVSSSGCKGDDPSILPGKFVCYAVRVQTQSSAGSETEEFSRVSLVGHSGECVKS